MNNDKASADYRDGVLEIHLPKSAVVKPRKVTVNIPSASNGATPQTIEGANADSGDN